MKRTTRPSPDALATWGRAILARQLERIREATPGALAGRDSECVHDLRVAIRRARHALKLFPVFHADVRCHALRGELGRAFKALGAVRDHDVLISTLGSLCGHVHAAASTRTALDSALSMLRDKAVQPMLAALRSAAYRDAVADLSAMAGRGPACPADDAVRSFAAQAVSSVLKKTCAWREQAGRSDAAAHLHALRIALRRLRYTCEFFADVYGGAMKKAIQCCVELQEILGSHQDACVATQLLEAAAASFAGRSKVLLTCGALIQMQREKEAGCHRAFAREWVKFPGRMSRRLKQCSGL